MLERLSPYGSAADCIVERRLKSAILVPVAGRICDKEGGFKNCTRVLSKQSRVARLGRKGVRMSRRRRTRSTRKHNPSRVLSRRVSHHVPQHHGRPMTRTSFPSLGGGLQLSFRRPVPTCPPKETYSEAQSPSHYRRCSSMHRECLLTAQSWRNTRECSKTPQGICVKSRTHKKYSCILTQGRV